MSDNHNNNNPEKKPDDGSDLWGLFGIVISTLATTTTGHKIAGIDLS